MIALRVRVIRFAQIQKIRMRPPQWVRYPAAIDGSTGRARDAGLSQPRRCANPLACV